MERICQVCNQLKKTPYKNFCRACYQKKWVDSIPEKQCESCGKKFNTAGTRCWCCLQNERNEESRKIQCLGCSRIGLIIANMTESLCIKCDRQKKEREQPERIEKRQKYNRDYSRTKKGTDLNAPIRRPTGKWKTGSGYVLIFKPTHPNADINGCILEHSYVMSEHLKRPLKKGESVHHKNGQRDDNRIENLEIWHRGQPSGQRVEEKIEWAKKFLEEYGFCVSMKL